MRPRYMAQRKVSSARATSRQGAQNEREWHFDELRETGRSKLAGSHVRPGALSGGGPRELCALLAWTGGHATELGTTRRCLCGMRPPMLVFGAPAGVCIAQGVRALYVKASAMNGWGARGTAVRRACDSGKRHSFLHDGQYWCYIGKEVGKIRGARRWTRIVCRGWVVVTDRVAVDASVVRVPRVVTRPRNEQQRGSGL